MKLLEGQKEHLLAAISAGLSTDKINLRAAEFDPPYKVSRQQVDYFRKSREVNFAAVKEEKETSALKVGFAVKENRVAALNVLACLLYDELAERKRIWLEQVKSIGSGVCQEVVEYEEFNEGEIRQLRGLFDDLAKEVGDRKTKLEHTGKDGKDLVTAVTVNIVKRPHPADGSDDRQ